MGRPKGSVNPTSKNARKERRKQEGRPKRATSAYLYYLSHLRDEYRKQGKPIPKVGEFTKDVSEKWGKMTEEDKKPFAKEAAVDKARYEREMAIFKPPRDINKPKRPQTAYFYFLADFRIQQKESGLAHKDIIKAAGMKWQSLTESEKAPYEESARGDRGRYERELATSKNNIPILLKPVPANGGGGGGVVDDDEDGFDDGGDDLDDDDDDDDE